MAEQSSRSEKEDPYKFSACYIMNDAVLSSFEDFHDRPFGEALEKGFTDIDAVSNPDVANSIHDSAAEQRKRYEMKGMRASELCFTTQDDVVAPILDRFHDEPWDEALGKGFMEIDDASIPDAANGFHDSLLNEGSSGFKNAVDINPVEEKLLIELKKMGFKKLYLNLLVLRGTGYDLKRSVDVLSSMSVFT